MCGISGILSQRPRLQNATPVMAMSRSMRHRGPDQHAAGVDRTNRYHYAMRRLKIIDLDGSQQPLISADGRYHLIFNGEIYNYLELKARLRKQGCRFKTNGDGEVVLHLFERYAEACLQHLRGMFCFAVWDAYRNSLFIARDRMGEKPLYYHHGDGEFLFSSELHSLLASNKIPIVPDERAVFDFFHYDNIPEPLTAIKGVHKLPAGSFMTVSANDGAVDIQQYWSMFDVAPLDVDRKGFLKLLRERLHNAVDIATRADVPIAVGLSGGVDSSIVATLASRYAPRRPMAISLGFETGIENNYDERADAQALAEFLGLQSHSIEVPLANVAASFDEFVSLSDDPVADISGLSYLTLLKKSREIGAPVMLFGHGGDELFRGYTWLHDAFEAEKTRQRTEQPYRHAPSAFGSHLAFGPDSDRDNNRPAAFSEFMLDYVSAEERLQKFATPAFHKAVTSGTSELNSGAAWPTMLSGTSPAPGLVTTALVCATYLCGNNIVIADRVGMSQSIEARLPLLDRDLVECVAGALAAGERFGPITKDLLREAVRKDLPDFVLQREKRPFRPPTSQWFGAISNAYGGDLIDGFLQSLGVLTPEAAVTLSTTVSESRVSMPFFFRAIVLERWFRHMHERSSAAAQQASRHHYADAS